MSRTTGGGPDHEQPTGGRYGAPVMDTERVNAMSLGTCCEPRRAAARERRQERRVLVVHPPRRFYSDPKGRNRLSCIFSLMCGWMPRSNKLPTAFRFDNPFAEQAFPDDLLVPDWRLSARRDGSGVRIEWE